MTAPPLSLSELARLDGESTQGERVQDDAEDRGMLSCGGGHGPYMIACDRPSDAALIAYLRTHLPEIRERLALPVMETCRDCAHRYDDECGHSQTPPRVLSPASRYLPARTEPQKIERDGAPPAFCPLRRRAGGE